MSYDTIQPHRVAKVVKLRSIRRRDVWLKRSPDKLPTWRDATGFATISPFRRLLRDNDRIHPRILVKDARV